MKSWTPLWSSVVGSSLWDEPDAVVKVFITMMALKDMDHVYRGTAYQLSRDSRKTEAEVLEALKVLASPDRRRIQEQEFEGRRIEAVEDGWLILNGEKYREMVQKEMARRRNARAQAAWRERQKQKIPHGTPLAGEAAFVKADASGNHKLADEIASRGLPESQEDHVEPGSGELSREILGGGR